MWRFLKRAEVTFRRALGLRCPNCGGGAILDGWLRMPPWDLLLYGGMGLMPAAPFLFFPFSRTLFLAVDLLFRPATTEEMAPDRGDPAPGTRTGSR